MHFARLLLLVVSLCCLPRFARAQGTARDSARSLPPIPALRLRQHSDSLVLQTSPTAELFGLLQAPYLDGRTFARAIAERRIALGGQPDVALRGPGALAGPTAPSPVEIARQAGKSADRDVFGPYADLGLRVVTRLEAKVQKDRNERCLGSDFLSPGSNCRGTFQPNFDFQFGVRSGGVVADRLHLNVDYDSQREFDASNNISVYYAGRQDEILQRLEVGNVSFQPPASRFITQGIPSGNYGLQALGQLGPMSFRAIAAQQKGNVIRDRIFTLGDRAVQPVEREIADFQMERRRFFWVIDPARAFPERYPNVDILSGNLPALAASIPPGQRPRRVLVYRYRPPSLSGSAARDINGPYAFTRFARSASVVGPYEILQQGIDYYIDPSNLWIALVSPVNRGERLAVSYTVTGPGGQEATISSEGGTLPITRSTTGLDTLNLLWDSEVLPTDAVFDREIRSVYRLGGEEILRGTVELKVVIGSGSDQEKPVGPGIGGRTFDTYLQLFGLAQPTNSSVFDAENRLWPRVGDPNQALGAGGAATKLIRDNFVVFPSLKPFADSGFAKPPNPVNDSIYRTADEDLTSSRRPPTQYRLRARYSAEGGAEGGAISLGSVQIRPNSEQLTLDQTVLVRDVDYRVDYELGRVSFLHPDTLFTRQRRLSVRYEEQPVFASTPTSIFGLATEFPMEHGQLNFTAISQSQRTQFNRPQLGFEPVSALIAGVSGNFTWESQGLSTVLDRLPFVRTSAMSTVNVQGEMATSRPTGNRGREAYLESFEGEGAVPVQLVENAWRRGSQPAIRGAGVVAGGVPFTFPLDSAATLVWQNLPELVNAQGILGQPLQYFAEQIDSQFVFNQGATFRTPEILLWNTLYPRSVGGLPRYGAGPVTYGWQTAGGTGRRWRSISQSLSPTGADLSRVETLDFFVQIDTSVARRSHNPTFVMDFGDISENSVAFVPETLTVRQRPGAGAGVVDSIYTGRRLQGFDVLDSERDSVTRSFDAARNDTGIGGDRVDSIVVRDLIRGTTQTERNVAICTGTPGLAALPLGDTRVICTVGNRRLDEEDLDLDGFLNIRSDQRNSESILRYVVDLSDPARYTHVGRCGRALGDTTTAPGATGPVCWVQVRMPFNAPTDQLNSPLVRRIKSMRITMVSGPQSTPDELISVPIARFRLVGSPWVKRSDRALAGIGGARQTGSGYVIAATIGTQDYDPSRGIFYQSPPGVTNEADLKQPSYGQTQIQINEKSLRLIAGDVPLYNRAEAYFRFPEGDRNFMGYTDLRVWARGRNKGWGAQGDLQFFVKIGRDADNFYLYRTPVSSGTTRDAWLPEVRVDLNKLRQLRSRLQNDYLRGGDTLSCTGIDSALVVNSDAALAGSGKRYAACDGGYIAYSANPGTSPPNLAAVEELAVGMVRVRTDGVGGAIMPGDSLELWVDDIRLTGAVGDPGYAGQVALNIVAGDVGTLQANVSRRDGSFHQLSEQPSFITDNQLALATSLRLDKFLPARLGLALPFTVNHVSSTSDPTFLTRSDIAAEQIAGLRAPSTSATSYSLAARRLTPIESGLLGPLLNNLSLTSSYTTSSAQSEFQQGDSRAFSSLLDFSLVANSRTRRLPAWVTGALGHLPAWLRESDAVRSLRDATVRWNPSLFRITSGYATSSDDRRSFALPIASGLDTARVVRGLTDVWRNASTLELRPFNNLSVHWDISSLRDLRNYGDSTAIVRAARHERGTLGGLDLGLERERQMNALVSVAPVVSSWIRPRLDVNASYTMLRDPNARSLLSSDGGVSLDSAADSLGTLRLPRRLTNSQGVSAGATVDLGRGLLSYGGRFGLVQRVAAAIQPMSVTWRQDLRSSYDGVGFTPGLGYQFGLGGVSSFRRVGDQLATSAGVTRSLGLTNALTLPLGLAVSHQYARTASTSWLRLADAQSVLEGSQTTFPDLSVRWNYQPTWLTWLVKSVGAQVRTAVTKSSSVQLAPGDLDGTSPRTLRTEQTTRQYPVNGSVTWGAFGGFSTTAGYNRSDRVELRSGARTEGTQRDVTVELGKAFTLPASLGWRSDQLRTRLGWQRGEAQIFYVVTGSDRKRITDNGRYSYNLNADSDVSETLSLSATISRLVNFDNNADRRFSQTLVSVVLHLTFFAGDLK